MLVSCIGPWHNQDSLRISDSTSESFSATTEVPTLVCTVVLYLGLRSSVIIIVYCCECSLQNWGTSCLALRPQSIRQPLLFASNISLSFPYDFSQVKYTLTLWTFGMSLYIVLLCVSSPHAFWKSPSAQSKGHFTLEVRIKEAQELSNPIGGKLKIGSKDFTLGVEAKVCQNDLVPMWHHFGTNIYLVLVQPNTP